MAETKHTRAPWTYQKIKKGGMGIAPMSSWTPCFEIYNGDGKSVDSLFIGFTLEETDASLFSAAPDLLSVCNALIEDREACGINENDPDDPMAIIVRKARAAVAKARGGTQ